MKFKRRIHIHVSKKKGPLNLIINMLTWKWGTWSYLTCSKPKHYGIYMTAQEFQGFPCTKTVFQITFPSKFLSKGILFCSNMVRSTAYNRLLLIAEILLLNTTGNITALQLSCDCKLILKYWPFLYLEAKILIIIKLSVFFLSIYRKKISNPSSQSFSYLNIRKSISKKFLISELNTIYFKFLFYALHSSFKSNNVYKNDIECIKKIFSLAQYFKWFYL